MKLTKDNILYGIIIVLILFLIGGNIQSKNKQQELYDKLEEQNRSIVEMDETVKEADGQYTKLVDYFNTSKDLQQDLKENNKELAKTIKKQNERLLMLNRTVLSLENKIDEGKVTQNENDSTIFDVSLTYPNADSSFINWDGSIFTKTKTYKGEWSFNELPLDIILTETERGLWKTRLIGPEWLVVDSIQVKSIPPKDFDEDDKRNWSLYLGGGYINSLDPNISNGISIGSGIRFKNHSVIVNATTNKTVNFNYYYSFTKFNKND